MLEKKIGIYVCTRGPSSMLFSCLESLTSQQCSPGWEIQSLVVAVNSAEEADLEPVQTFLADDLRISALADKTEALPVAKKGIPAIRNSCLEHALTRELDALIFLDDDCRAMSGWLASLTSVAERTNADAVAGPWMFLPRGVPSSLVPEAFWQLRAMADPSLGAGDFLFCSTASTRSVLIDLRSLTSIPEVLRFDEGRTHLGGSDTVFFDAWFRHGLTIAFAPGALVLEDASNDRLSLRWFLKRAVREGAFYAERRRSNYSGVGAVAAPGDNSVGGHFLKTAGGFVGLMAILTAKMLGFVTGRIGKKVRYYE